MKATSYSRPELIALLRRHGVAPTHQRLEIAHVLFGVVSTWRLTRY